MAEEHKEAPPNPMRDVYIFITIFVVIVILWFAAGGPGKADVRGALLQAPPPLGGGQAYGPGGQTQEPQFDQGSVAPPPQVQY